MSTGLFTMRTGIFSAIGAGVVVMAAGCGANESVAEQSPTGGDVATPTAPAPHAARGPAPASGLNEEGAQYIPATASFGKSLGIAQWSVVMSQRGDGRIRALDPAGKILTTMRVRSGGTNEARVVIIEAQRGRMVIGPKGVVEDSLDPRARSLIENLAGDSKTYLANGDVPYDACTTATVAALVAFAATLGACTLGAVTVFGCGAAMAAWFAAELAKNDACAPQTCVADHQCVDKYGAGYVCHGGACVYSNVTYPSEGGGGSSNGGYGGGGGYGSSCTSDWSCSLNDYCNMTEGRCMPLGGNGGGGGSSGFYGGGGGGACWSSFDCPYFASCAGGWCS